MIIHEEQNGGANVNAETRFQLAGIVLCWDLRSLAVVIKKKNQEKTENKIKDIFKKAAETGVKQEIRHWSEECNDPREACDIDIVTEYAMPDGTTKVVRSHTW